MECVYTGQNLDFSDNTNAPIEESREVKEKTRGYSKGTVKANLKENTSETKATKFRIKTTVKSK